MSHELAANKTVTREKVKQLLVVDGRLHLDLAISSTGSSQNYTQSYYMNGRDYVISGSCDEHVVRICCTRTGRRLKLLQAQSQFVMIGAAAVVVAAHREASDVQLGLT
ncbi:Hypothetical predicted protein [Olea europaea subsp. europaea]|uniref:Uncharacterized protein n=1 Tax=Olea europaea subsp. europaea TaxID=158383 RepID=A0A8S0PK08_OLEEU|nr:Hypothetical predicted protein [Olea europaea subsp. europaea]